MNTKSNIFLIASIMTVFSIMMIPEDISAHTSQNIITVTPINEEISLQKTVTTMSIPQDNELPWGAVVGGASDYLERYPVIIQFFDDEKELVHVAQVDVKGDGSYEYKFRVTNVDSDGEIENIFEGDYTVKIFRVIPNTNALV